MTAVSSPVARGAADRQPERAPDLLAMARLPSGTVMGAPRRWLRAEAVALLVGSLVAFSTTRQAWWLVPLTLLAPDLLMVGYLGGTRLGAHLYNTSHSTVLPILVVGFGWWQAKPLALALGLVWLAHIGMDRVLGYGLKYCDGTQHTHLGWIGRGATTSEGKGSIPHDDVTRST